MLEDVNDEIPLFTEREQETVLEGEPIGTKVTQVNAIDKDGTFPSNRKFNRWNSIKAYIVDISPKLEIKNSEIFHGLCNKFGLTFGLNILTQCSPIINSSHISLENLFFKANALIFRS